MADKRQGSGAKVKSQGSSTPNLAAAKKVHRSLSSRELADLVLPGGPSEKY
jgi:hypothetical protein